MKTIEERAIEWVDSQGAGSVHPYNRQAMVDAYIAAYEELTRWNDPKESVPDHEWAVLVRITTRIYDIGSYSNKMGRWLIGTNSFGRDNEFADGSDITNHAGWLNKMLVKAEYMPHQIRITGIHCERLQDISDAECLKEGVRVEFARNGSPMYYYFDTARWREVWFDTPREAFAALIDKVSGWGTWASNPWVVVYEFELVK